MDRRFWKMVAGLCLALAVIFGLAATAKITAAD